MTQAAIITKWIGDGITTFTAFRPEALDLFPTVTYQDITVQSANNIPPNPNIVIILVDVTDATLAAIKANTKYGAQSVIWEGNPLLSPVVTEAQYSAFLVWLSGKSGLTVVQWQGILGATSNGRTRYQIALDLITWLKTRPHA